MKNLTYLERNNGVFSKFRKITNTKNNKFTDDIW